MQGPFVQKEAKWGLIFVKIRVSRPLKHKSKWKADRTADKAKFLMPNISVRQDYWYNHLSQPGKKYGWWMDQRVGSVIVKSDVLADEAKRVFEEEVNITTEAPLRPGSNVGLYMCRT